MGADANSAPNSPRKAAAAAAAAAGGFMTIKKKNLNNETQAEMEDIWGFQFEQEVAR